MEKNIKISRPSGEDDYKVLCAFKNDGNSYIILDSKLEVLTSFKSTPPEHT